MSMAFAALFTHSLAYVSPEFPGEPMEAAFTEVLVVRVSTLAVVKSGEIFDPHVG